MFILYGVLIGTVVGVLARGDVRRLSKVSFHWMPAIFAGLAFQAVLFAPAVSDRVGGLGPVLYLGSTLVVLAAVVRNGRIPGLPVVIAGALCNVAAIAANGGYMPANPDALAALGKVVPATYSNSALLTNPALAPLTDVFALPRWVPFANVFSVGDVIICAGVVWAIVALLRGDELLPDVTAPWRSAISEQVKPLLGRLGRDPGGASEQPSLVRYTESTDGSLAAWDSRHRVRAEGHKSPDWPAVQGKPVVRRGTQS